jgi:hypothetical protein
MQVVQAYTDAYGRQTSRIITPTVVKETQAQVRLLLMTACLQLLLSYCVRDHATGCARLQHSQHVAWCAMSLDPYS